jgi:hypothetical protein
MQYLIAFLVLAACGPQERLVLIAPAETARTPPTIRQACSLTEQKCSRCHDLERIRLAHHALVDWPIYVERMRRQPGSGITVADTRVILRCLDHLREQQRLADR